MPAFYEGDSVTPKGQESLWTEYSGDGNWKDLTQVWVSSVQEEEEEGMGSQAFCHSIGPQPQGETGSRLLFAFGGTVTHPLDKCHKPSLSSCIHV